MGMAQEVFPKVCALKGRCKLHELEAAYASITGKCGRWQEICGQGEQGDIVVDADSRARFEQQHFGASTDSRSVLNLPQERTFGDVFVLPRFTFFALVALAVVGWISLVGQVAHKVRARSACVSLQRGESYSLMS